MGRLNYCSKCHEVAEDGQCGKCKIGFPVFMVGWRDEKIGELVEEYKFFAVRAIGDKLAEILDESLPYFAEKVVVVPLPTIMKHVRERGLDHTLEVAKKLAKKRGWQVQKIIERKKNTVQLGVGEKQRRKQAGEAYKIREINEKKDDVVYLLLDDIWTTGASMEEAARMMRENGMEKIVACVLAVNRRGRKPKIRR